MFYRSHQLSINITAITRLIVTQTVENITGYKLKLKFCLSGLIQMMVIKQIGNQNYSFYLRSAFVTFKIV